MNTIQTPKEALLKAANKVGGITALARALHVSGHAVVYQWGLTRVPAEQCPEIEVLTGVTCEELRPDVNWAVLRIPNSPPASFNVTPIVINPTPQGV